MKSKKLKRKNQTENKKYNIKKPTYKETAQHIGDIFK